jgi:hypothetical protein
VSVTVKSTEIKHKEIVRGKPGDKSPATDSGTAAEALGRRGQKYVSEHFLLPDRIADYLMAMDMARNQCRDRQIPHDSIISFHPWFKMSKRRD